MKGGAFGLPSIPTSLDAAKQQAADAAKAKAQNAATSVASSDAVQAGLSRVEGAAGSVGLGDQFASAKQAALDKLESVTGLQFSSPPCAKDQIDVPSVSNVLVSTLENPYEPVTAVDKFFSYVIVDSRNPAAAYTDNKAILWYISIMTSVSLITLGTLYGTVSKG